VEEAVRWQVPTISAINHKLHCCVSVPPRSLPAAPATLPHDVRLAWPTTEKLANKRRPSLIDFSGSDKSNPALAWLAGQPRRKVRLMSDKYPSAKPEPKDSRPKIGRFSLQLEKYP
jgi:hypothetical protein